MSESGPIDTLLSALKHLKSDLGSQGVSWALVGGLAITLRVLPRTTEDVDVMLALAGDSEAQKVIGFLFSRGWRFVKEHQDDEHQIASARIQGPGRGDVIVDLLVAVSGIEQEVVAAAEEMEIAEGLELPVASLASLIALKILSRRRKDEQDLEALLEAASPEELRDSARLLELIALRGFDQERDLLADLDQELLKLKRSAHP